MRMAVPTVLWLEKADWIHFSLLALTGIDHPDKRNDTRPVGVAYVSQALRKESWGDVYSTSHPSVSATYVVRVVDFILYKNTGAHRPPDNLNIYVTDMPRERLCTCISDIGL
jgi:hypothetical protein